MKTRTWAWAALVAVAACGGPDYAQLCTENYERCRQDALVTDRLEPNEDGFREALVVCISKYNMCYDIYVENCSYKAGKGKVCDDDQHEQPERPES